MNKIKAFIGICFLTIFSLYADDYVLTPMTSEQIVYTKENIIEFYAHDLFKSGYFETELQALEFAREDINHESDDKHYFFNITSTSVKDSVGYLWFDWIQDQKNEFYVFGEVYVQALFLEKEFRGKGIAKKVMLNFENLVKKQGAHSIGLYVFAHNEAAYNLYKKLDYEVVKIHMNPHEQIMGYYMKKIL